MAISAPPPSATAAADRPSYTPRGERFLSLFTLPPRPHSRASYPADAPAPPPPYITVCAPMVRYSKLAFRHVVRQFGVDVAYTPMILADVFKNSPFARDTEFTTAPDDTPVVLQLAASNAEDFAAAAVMAAPYVDAVDLNCGCPQKWAFKERIGSYLMEHPEKVADMVAMARRRVPELVIAVKIRVHDDAATRTVEMARRLEKMGAGVLAVHGRTRHQKSSEPLNVDAIRLVKENVRVPVIANGNVFTRADADALALATGADGIMAARGLLANPALFAGYDSTPIAAAKAYFDYAVKCGTHAYVIHHHLMYCLEAHLSVWQRKRFNVCTSVAAMADYFRTWDAWNENEQEWNGLTN
ncbi:hypothetical protein AMAG_06545 [Allomyces macrogynus ATCC 38327]|uniref:tRNA-dihydrouridine(20a/20b) synthase [NAD(P)+] n=1 Tax=Allomyces macrogynus (strain ATCC 38327) TaxID=578462 RepID=A0A0L0SH97_ALLM3|nr:hypothetical protein AMAG_06545 [Allomyces macrogynus ATCC 38327]|eukprot:KNE61745.1 hypothetical protein AMAG_06545 [Allomyces macrogynus ATCC 38327]